jgi:hypothetical protein
MCFWSHPFYAKFVSNIPQHPKGYTEQEDFEAIARTPQGNFGSIFTTYSYQSVDLGD